MVACHNFIIYPSIKFKLRLLSLKRRLISSNEELWQGNNSRCSRKQQEGKCWLLYRSGDGDYHNRDLMWYIKRVGQNCTCTPYLTKYLWSPCRDYCSSTEYIWFWPTLYINIPPQLTSAGCCLSFVQFCWRLQVYAGLPFLANVNNGVLVPSASGKMPASGGQIFSQILGQKIF